MITISARNVHDALPLTLHKLLNDPNVERQESRNGPVLKFGSPCCIEYQRPYERVLFWPERDCNPFFHLMESLWMIAGRNDVAFPEQYNSKFGQYSDNGKTFHGAYGHRWRHHFDVDQLSVIANALTENPECRRQVLGMWDPTADLNVGGKDLPCNLAVTFQRNANNGSLNMTVFNRSNDIVWGALGANAVHFSFLLEYMAWRIGCTMGKYWQISANMHGYLGTIEPVKCLADDDIGAWSNPYEDMPEVAASGVKVFPIASGTSLRDWNKDLERLLCTAPGDLLASEFCDAFFRLIAVPMALAYNEFRNRENPDRFARALAIVDTMIDNCDWKLACRQWLERRQIKAEAKKGQD